MKDRFVTWLLGLFLGEIDVNMHIFTDDDSVLVFDLTVTTKHGMYTFPILKRPIPGASVGYLLKGEIDSGL
jgi:hypothetical protein